MTKTIGEIIENIQSLYSKGLRSDDSRLEDQYIYSKMVRVRSRLIAQSAKKKQKISQWNYQVIPCVELIKAPVHDCPCLPPSGCDILKSKYKLPSPLTDLNNHLIQSVTSLDGNIVFSEIGWKDAKYKKHNKYTSNTPNYVIRNGYLLLFARSNYKLKFVTIEGLFDDPLEVIQFPSYCDNNCDDCINCDSFLDKEFNIDNELLDTLIDMCKIELIEQFSQMSEDLTNNSRDNVIEQSK